MCSDSEIYLLLHPRSMFLFGMLLLLLLSHFSRVRLCETPQTAAHRAPPSLGFSLELAGQLGNCSLFPI